MPPWMQRTCRLRAVSDLQSICSRRYAATGRPVHAGDSERTRQVTSFYYQSAIDQAASKASVRLMPATMLYSGRSVDGSHLLRSAEYLHKEMPIRLAHRITGFRGLPFIVGCNPSIFAVHELYIRAFNQITDFPAVTDLELEAGFSEMLTQLLDEHKDVISMLAEGFNESRIHIQDDELVKQFLDKTLTSRLATRMLCEHHLLLHDVKPNQIGIIFINFSPKNLIEKNVERTRKLCLEKYGKAPEVRLSGHLSVTFAYIPQPLDYMLFEVLKNAMRATVESHVDMDSDHLPPINISVANNDVDFIIRISDMGGGIKHEVLHRVWDYGFTTPGVTEKWSDYRIFERTSSYKSPDSLTGYGFGLPSCRAYAEYLNGDIRLQTMQGIGTDVYIRLRHIDGKLESFRI
jgi:[3-methyl-2-oxobutanoate dehydrogenase (acetyl-transferring)] kinase